MAYRPHVMTVNPERTFLEKFLIPHAEGTTEKRAPQENLDRMVPDLSPYSRDYYDVHQSWTHPEYRRTKASMLDLADVNRAMQGRRGGRCGGAHRYCPGSLSGPVTSRRPSGASCPHIDTTT
ncbi:hypothetical protein [Rhizobium sp. LjRoot258]|uniref:hypothetical protein n=1 Tax=Rhizobium sp. LjRoot258 TaxID=3342299 RepID=UPI003ECFDFA8